MGVCAILGSPIFGTPISGLRTRTYQNKKAGSDLNPEASVLHCKALSSKAWPTSGFQCKFDGFANLGLGSFWGLG